MRLRVTVAVLVAAFLGAGAAAAAPNPHLTAAREAKSTLAYDQALVLAGEALRTGENDPETLIAIYRLAGEVAAGLDRRAEAEAWFRRLLALEPAAELPAGTSPKITAPFTDARGFIQRSGPLAVRAEPATSGVILVVERDPLEMVAGARVLYQSSAGTLGVIEGRGGARIAVELPRGTFAHHLAAIDEHGNELVRIELDLRGQFVTTGPGDRAGRRWPLAAAFTAITLGAGVYFGLDTRDAEDDLAALNQRSKTEDIDAAEAHELVVRGRRSAALANLGFAAAGVGAAITGWLIYRRLAADDRPVEVAPVVAPDTAGLTVRLAF